MVATCYHPPHARGFCRKCQRYHSIGVGNTQLLARQLTRQIEKKGTIDLFSSQSNSEPGLNTDILFSDHRGKMFGILECINHRGHKEILYAFSGQYNGIWNVEGWVPPILDVFEFWALTCTTEKQIKNHTRELHTLKRQQLCTKDLRNRRRMLSRDLMEEIQKLYTVQNFKGERAALKQAFYGGRGIPTGTGDCCAPKLLHFAATKNLLPIGLSEFFIGKETKSGRHRHGDFTTPCNERCTPLLGFMLCGINDLQLPQ